MNGACGWFVGGGRREFLLYIVYIFGSLAGERSCVWEFMMVGNIISVVCPTANVCIQIRVSLSV